MLGKLKGLLFEEEPQAPAAKPVAPTPATQPTPQPVLTNPGAVVGQLDQQLAGILEKSLLDSNLPGFDYLEFRQALMGMKNIPMTESQKFEAVFATAQAMQVTKTSLLSAVDHYLQVLENKRKEFDECLSAQQASEVTARENSIQTLEQQLQAKAAQITELTAAIQELRRQQDEAKVAITQAQLDIQNKKLSFEATYASIANNLQDDRRKIDTYLK